MVLSKTCEMCGMAFGTDAPAAIYCPECRLEMRRIRDREEYRRGGRKRKRKAYQKNKDPDPLAIEQGWMNLAWAMVEQAFKDHDLDWLQENGRMWLIFSGRNIGKHNFTQLLEELVYAKEEKEKTG